MVLNPFWVATPLNSHFFGETQNLFKCKRHHTVITVNASNQLINSIILEAYLVIGSQLLFLAFNNYFMSTKSQRKAQQLGF